MHNITYLYSSQCLSNPTQPLPVSFCSGPAALDEEFVEIIAQVTTTHHTTPQLMSIVAASASAADFDIIVVGSPALSLSLSCYDSSFCLDSQQPLQFQLIELSNRSSAECLTIRFYHVFTVFSAAMCCWLSAVFCLHRF